MTNFKQLLNNPGAITVGSGGYSPASGFMPLSTGGATAIANQATLEGVTINATTPLRFVVAQAGHARLVTLSYAMLTVFQATAVDTTGNQLTGVSVLEGSSDRAYTAGDVVYCSDTSGAFREIQAAVNAVESGRADIATYSLAGGL